MCETKYNSLFLKDQRISWLLFFSSNQMQLFSLYAFWVTLRGCLFCVSLCFSTKNKTFLEERRMRIQKKLWDCFANLSTKTEKLLQPCVLFILNMFLFLAFFARCFMKKHESFPCFLIKHAPSRKYATHFFFPKKHAQIMRNVF